MKNLIKGFAGLTALFAAGAANAAVPAVIGTSLTVIQDDSLAVIDLMWPVVLAVAGGFVLIKIVKRLISGL